MPEEVRAWAEQISIPTYRIGQPDKNPMFLEKRVYQGSSGAVYPHPVIDRIFDDKEDKVYTAVYLENRYLKIMVLPEIGGRLQMALDKTNGYHFIYYNRVIKPALVGLAGPWISGGIEFNWPQHHRPSTFDPLDWRIEAHPDGSKTVWCAEIESMFRTKGMHGFRLYPDWAFLEIRVQLYNRTATPQTFLWWANPAVHVHDDYQTVFPPDVHAVMDHGKRAVSTFPIATGTYYKVDYAPGTDISRYKNIPVPTSYMAYHSDFDFMGDYDHRAQAGMLHVANHHVVPGKKQWTWGNGDFGHAWDRQLTDEDGPYIELMCGAYTDNQPDFSWIQPGEEKAFSQIFMPYKEIGPASNANEHAVIHLELVDQTAHFGVYVTAPRQFTVRLTCRGQVVYKKLVDLNPETVLLEQVSLPFALTPTELTLAVIDGASVVLEYTPLPDENPEIPAPALPAPAPETIATIEELYLNGLHLEQYRHATYSPEAYYLEAIRRDPGDSRSNNALGRLLYRRGKFKQAEDCFRKAVQRLTLRNPNPYDGEPYYNLGLALNMQGRYQEAFTAFHKAIWNAAWRGVANFELARISSREKKINQALDYLEQSLANNQRHHQARHLKIALLRRQSRLEAAREEAAFSLRLDPFEYGALWELFLIDGDAGFEQLARSNPAVNIELAWDYLHGGLYNEAIDLLKPLAHHQPMAAYTLAWTLAQSGDIPASQEMYQQAAACSPDYCFPNRLEEVNVLEAAMSANPADARAPYYLGNFWYAHRRHAEAIECWEKSAALDPNFATLQRNLGLAYYNHRHEPARALACYQKAFALDSTDGRVFYELDQLYKRLSDPPEQRLARFQEHAALVAERDDLTLEYITTLNLLGRYDEAYQALMARNFHPWEGGEGKVTDQYVLSLVEKSRELLAGGDPQSAIELLEHAQAYPNNLGEGKLFGAQENNIFYLLGCGFEMLGDEDRAEEFFIRATIGPGEPASATYYNDQPPEQIFYQGLAFQKLRRSAAAREIFQKLIDFGKLHMDDEVKIDYFAVSLPDFAVFDVDLNQRNRLHCHYMLGLGYLGMRDTLQARAHFDAILAVDANHLGAMVHQKLITTLYGENNL